MEHIKVTMNDIKKKLSKDVFGMDMNEAIEKNICVKCKNDVQKDGRIYSEAGKKEYRISGLCEICFDEIAMSVED